MTAPPIATSRSSPFATSALQGESAFWLMSHAWGRDGIDEARYGTNSGFISLDSGARQVTVSPYYGHVGGAFAEQSTNAVIDVPAASSQTRIDRVVTRREPSNDRCVLDIVEGTPGSGTPPSLTRTLTGGVWEYSHGQYVAHADGSLSGRQDERVLRGETRYGRSTYRPPDATPGELFYEHDTDRTVQLVQFGGPWRVVHEDTEWQLVSLRGHWRHEQGSGLFQKVRDSVVYLQGAVVRRNEFRFVATSGGWEQFGQLPSDIRPHHHFQEACVVPSMAVRSMAFRVLTGGEIEFDLDGEDLPTGSSVHINTSWAK